MTVEALPPTIVEAASGFIRTSVATGGDWAAYFRDHAQMQVRDVGAVGVIDSDLRRALVRSLRRFQVGERDGSRIITQVTESRDPFLTDDLRTAIRSYIAEEHQHGRLLEQLLYRLDSEPAAGDVSAMAFKVVRRLLGLRGKLVVLVAAEMIGAAFYDAVVQTVDDDTVRLVLASIRDDERTHLRFGVSLTRGMVDSASGSPARLMWRCGLLTWLWAVTLGALAVLSVDHAPFLRRAGWRRVAKPVLSDLRWFTREFLDGQ